MKSLSTSDVKLKNKENVLRYIYRKRSTTQQAIGDALNLSRPTVIQIIKELEEKRVIEKNGYCESTGGRKANAIRFISNARIAVGVELLIDRYELVAVNLYGETLKHQPFSVPFQNDSSYYRQVCDSVSTFIDELGIDPKRILGIGIVLQGLISAEGDRVTYGKILNCTGLTIDAFTQHLPYPCMFYHDAEAAAQDELWQSPWLLNAIYINIRSDISGAVIVDREFLKGAELKSGVFEHMTIVPNGKPCYCGNKGCLNTYCSTTALLKEPETLDIFFWELRNGSEDARKRWLDYLHYLAVAINNLHMFIDCDVILGGTIAKYLQGSDLSLLHQLVQDRTAFPTEREFIKISCCRSSSINRGAALPYVKKYLDSIIGKEIQT